MFLDVGIDKLHKIGYENTCTVYIEDRVRVDNGYESVNVLVGKKRYELVTLGTSYG